MLSLTTFGSMDAGTKEGKELHLVRDGVLPTEYIPKPEKGKAIKGECRGTVLIIDHVDFKHDKRKRQARRK